MVHYEHPEYKVVAPDPIPPTPTTVIYIDSDNKYIFDSQVEGADLTLNLKTTETLLADCTVDWTITHGATLPNEVIFNDNVSDPKFDYNSINTDTMDSDFPAVTGSATILGGTNSVSVVIPSLDDSVNTLDKGSYKTFTITLSNPSDPAVSIYEPCSSSVGLISDATVAPSIEGSVKFDVKLHELAMYEPLNNPETGDQEQFTRGVDLNGYTNIRSVVIDDVPMTTIKLLPSDIVSADVSVDYNIVPSYFQVIVQSGRRK